MIVNWSPRARRELLAQLNFIALDKPSAADRMAELVAKHTSLLAEFPDMGRPGKVAPSRELAIHDTPFIAVYSIHNSRVQIMRLLRGEQRWP